MMSAALPPKAAARRSVSVLPLGSSVSGSGAHGKRASVAVARAPAVVDDDEESSSDSEYVDAREEFGEPTNPDTQRHLRSTSSSSSLRSDSAAVPSRRSPRSPASSGLLAPPSLQSIETRTETWAMKWSACGTMLLVCGADGVLRVYPRVEPASAGSAVLSPVPRCAIRAHVAAITCADWTRDGRAVTASIDRSVRVWSPARPDACVSEMVHPDIVTCVACSPINPAVVLTASLDNRVRLWETKEGGGSTLLRTVDLGEFATSVAWAPSGACVVAGTDNGHLYLLDSATLDVQRRISVRSFSGKKSKAGSRKITGIACQGVHAFVTTNDCRVRKYEIKDLAMVAKFKGLRNKSSVQLRAAVSPAGNFVVSGSEDCRVLVWAAHSTPAPSSSSGGLSALLGKRRRAVGPVQTLQTESPVTAAVFVPGCAEGRYIVTADQRGLIHVFDRLELAAL
eukprot:m51a1_g5605 hypothetical protein (453) ;mRNA; f:703434-704987